MKSVIFFLLFCCAYSGSLIAQQGFKVIHKAEAEIEAGNYKKAERMLKRAVKMDYGWCGNAHIEAENAIWQARSDMALRQGNFKKARAFLDSLWTMNRSPETDFKLVAIWQQELGDNYLAERIDKMLESVWVTETDYAGYCAFMPIPGASDTLVLGAGYPLVRMPFSEYQDLLPETNGKIWKEKFVASPLYEQIKKPK